MTNDQKLELGIEIVSAMKASAYGVGILDGRIMALEGTEVDKMENTPEQSKPFYIDYCKREKERLHEQAMFVADIVLKKIKELNL